MEGGIEPERIGTLTFREIDLIMQRRKSDREHDWAQTRVIWGALAHKKPTDLIRLSTDPEPIDWSVEKANDVIKRFGWQQ